MTNKALLYELGKSLSFGRLSLLGKVLWPMLLASSDDQGRGLAEPDAVKWYVCPNVQELTAENIPPALQEMVEQDMVILYTDSRGRQLYQVKRWWEYQRMQWAQPSQYDAPDDWQDRVRCWRNKEYICQNWPTKEGDKEEAKPEEDAELPPRELPREPPRELPTPEGEAPNQLNVNQLKPNQRKRTGDNPPPAASAEEELAAVFGPKQPTELPATRHWSERMQEEPWRGWSDGHFRERDGVSVSAQERIGVLLERYTGQRPRSDGQWLGWGNTAIGICKVGDGNWRGIEKGIKTAANYGDGFVPHVASRKGEVNGWINAVERACATTPEVSESERMRQRMLQDPQYQAGVEIERRRREREAEAAK